MIDNYTAKQCREAAETWLRWAVEAENERAFECSDARLVVAHDYLERAAILDQLEKAEQRAMAAFKRGCGTLSNSKHFYAGSIA